MPTQHIDDPSSDDNQILKLAALGWRLAPASRVSKASCFSNAADLASSDPAVLMGWKRQYPRCNWRVYMGGSGIFALDLDVPPGHAHDGIKALKRLVDKHGPIPDRPMIRSGGGGLVLFFKHTNERIIKSGGKPKPGIDPRSGRQSQTIPPSIHVVTGQPYKWLIPPWELAPPEAPGWLLKLLLPPPDPVYRVVDSTYQGNAVLNDAVMKVLVAGEGDRNGTLNRQAYRIGRIIHLVGRQEAEARLYDAGRQIGLDDKEINDTLKSGIDSGARLTEKL